MAEVTQHFYDAARAVPIQFFDDGDAVGIYRRFPDARIVRAVCSCGESCDIRDLDLANDPYSDEHDDPAADWLVVHRAVVHDGYRRLRFKDFVREVP